MKPLPPPRRKADPLGAGRPGPKLPSALVKLLSVNVGAVRDAEWRGQALRTGIFKEPAAGPVALRALGLDGDAQADLTVHGGVDKAVYAYPISASRPRTQLPEGGEKGGPRPTSYSASSVSG